MALSFAIWGVVERDAVDARGLAELRTVLLPDIRANLGRKALEEVESAVWLAERNNGELVSR